MAIIFRLVLKSALRDPYLLFWSILLPVGGTLALGYFVDLSDYPMRIATGMMAMAVLFYALTTTIYAVLAQRRRGVYRLLRITPMPLWQYICSVSGAWTLIALVCAWLVWGAGSLMFQLPFAWGSFGLLTLTVLVAALGYVFASFFVSSLCRSEAHASMISNFILLPLLFGSEAFYSLHHAPYWIQTVSRLNPFQWFVDGLRSSLEGNVGDWLLRMGCLLAVMLIALLAAVRTFKFSEGDQ